MKKKAHYQLCDINCAADQHLSFHYIDDTIPLLPSSNLWLYSPVCVGLTAVSGVCLSPALTTCETRQVLLAGVSGGFPGYSRFAPPINWLVSMSVIILKGTLN